MRHGLGHCIHMRQELLACGQHRVNHQLTLGDRVDDKHVYVVLAQPVVFALLRLCGLGPSALELAKEHLARG